MEVGPPSPSSSPSTYTYRVRSRTEKGGEVFLPKLLVVVPGSDWIVLASTSPGGGPPLDVSSPVEAHRLSRATFKFPPQHNLPDLTEREKLESSRVVINFPSSSPGKPSPDVTLEFESPDHVKSFRSVVEMAAFLLPVNNGKAWSRESKRGLATGGGGGSGGSGSSGSSWRLERFKVTTSPTDSTRRFSLFKPPY
ncbi:hypothetical protein HK104_010436 [Borealophlyctis nickersoniae]|nr:hypothetical protein HK104_010436 [Borealophlyctis nickersoniae]